MKKFARGGVPSFCPSLVLSSLSFRDIIRAWKHLSVCSDKYNLRDNL